MILYVRCTVGTTAENYFFDLIEVESTDAVTILDAILTKHGIDKDFLVSNFIGLATDGASVMTGSIGNTFKTVIIFCYLQYTAKHTG